MEKMIRHIQITFFALILSSLSYSQEILSSLEGEYQIKSFNIDSLQSFNRTVIFPTRSYQNHFDYINTSISGNAFVLRLNNDVLWKKHLFLTHIGLSLHSYDYNFRLTNTDSLSQTPEDASVTQYSDQEIWDAIHSGNGKTISISNVYPAVIFGFGYKKEFLSFKKLSFNLKLGLNMERRFSALVEDQNLTLTSSLGPNANPIAKKEDFIHQKFLVGGNLGFGFRFGSSNFSLNFYNTFTRVDNKQGLLNFKEQAMGISYTKNIGLTKIAREQVVYDEYQFVAQARSSEYRTGDKYLYILFNGANKTSTDYLHSSPIPNQLITNNGDTINQNIEGHKLTPNNSLSINFNTFATKRWMVGLGVNIYNEYYNSFGIEENIQTGTTSVFNPSENTTVSDASNNSQHTSNSFVGASFNTAIYVSRRILKLDPYIRMNSTMIMQYDAPEFLNGVGSWQGTSFFPTHSIGAGIDLRLRIVNSKYLMIGFEANYIINPHTNFTQFGLRIGYYRKKKNKGI